MKRLLVTVIILSLSTLACDAFKESYGPSQGTLPTGNLGEEPVGGNENIADYASDKSVCEAVEGVIAVKSQDDGTAIESNEFSTTEVPDGSVEKSEVSATAEKVSSYTTKVTVTSGEKELSFTLKQVAEKEFLVCSVVYGELKAKSGTITVSRFNDGADVAKTVNSGSFGLEFLSEATDAVKVMKDLADVETTVTVDGQYNIEGLKESVVAQ